MGVEMGSEGTSGDGATDVTQMQRRGPRDRELPPVNATAGTVMTQNQQEQAIEPIRIEVQSLQRNEERALVTKSKNRKTRIKKLPPLRQKPEGGLATKRKTEARPRALFPFKEITK